MLENHAKLMQFFSSTHEVVGRKKLQKMIYILKKCEIPFEERYQFHFYGPYSEELTLRVEEMCNLGFISETREEKKNYYQYRYQLTDSGRDFLTHYEMDLPPLNLHIEEMNGRSSRFLELVSTMLFFEHLPKDEITEKVFTVKSAQNYTQDDIDEGWKFIEHLRSIH
ncbi:YwgA family protein [Halobacillus litoralis]|uniref:YwgA family protein n=1 Tax=Halobacillus litoralis TaxID=45668 RepID=A0A845F7I8_9BACI|nr:MULTISPECIES: YwgA family protein [Halobacillus]MEC3884997.1 YwgA family protein [Halobacillus sp. HZG1]MYL69647.1 YwgA family protein [Halobacillus litoralis]